MNSFQRGFFSCAILTGVLAGCSKMTNPYFNNGSAPTLTASTTTIAAATSDSLSNVLTLNWTDPKYATAPGTEKYTIQIDSSGRNFAQAVTFVVSGALTDTFIAKTINNVVLGFGGAFGVPYNVDVRVVSSYANNNEQLNSNSITLSVTPYKIPPKVAPPTSGKLFLVGDATQGGWTNPVPVPSQQFEEVDSVDYAGVFNLIGGKQYLALPVNGDWSNKYAVGNTDAAAAGGSFGYNFANNFTGPATDGWYTIWFNFQTGVYTVTPYTGFVPTNLFMVGDATPGAWNNPVPVPSQQFTQVNATQFTLTLTLIGGKQYLFLPVNGDWSNKYAVGNTNAGATGGTFGYNLANNFTGPTADGTYTITADFLTWTYTVH